MYSANHNALYTSTGVLGFGDIDFSVLDEDYYEARSDVLVFVNWKGPCTGIKHNISKLLQELIQIQTSYMQTNLNN